MRCRPVEAVLAAAIFAAGLPGLAQSGQSQLAYGFGVPLAFLSLWNLRRTGRIEHVGPLILWISLQTLCSVYTGLFLSVSLAVFGGWLLVLDRQLNTPSDVNVRRSFKGAWFVRGLASVVVLIPAIGAVLLLREHEKYGALYGLEGEWGKNHLLASLSYLKAFYATWIGADVPIQYENNMFIGLVVLFLFSLELSQPFPANPDRPRPEFRGSCF